MSMKKIKNAVAVNGTYMKDGQEKKNYVTIGSLFEKDDGSLSLKLDALPAGNNWDGWVSFFDPKSQR